MAVYDYATTFTQLLQQKYAKELCSDALTQSNQHVAEREKPDIGV